MREAISHNRKLTPSSSRFRPRERMMAKAFLAVENVFKSLGVVWSGIGNIKLFSATLILMYPLKGKAVFGAR